MHVARKPVDDLAVAMTRRGASYLPVGPVAYTFTPSGGVATAVDRGQPSKEPLTSLTRSYIFNRVFTPCPHCRHERPTVRYDFGREKILRCAQCGLLYLHPWPKPEEIQDVYGDSYFENQQFLEGDNSGLFGYVDYVAERFNKQPQYASIARELQGFLPPCDQEPRLLEVGCGFGYFLNEAFEEGFSVAGLEFNSHAVDRLRRKYAFPILAGGLEAVRLEPGAYDVIAMFDVIEHLLDPFGALDIAYEALAPGGILVVSTVDAESWVSRALGKRLEDFRRTREHLVFFGRNTLTEALTEHGFDTLSLRSIGHTFELSFLLERLTLYNRRLFGWLRRLADRTGFGSMSLSVNPRTKMIAFARKCGARKPMTLPSPGPAAADEGAGTDAVLIDELAVLEAASPRHYQWVFDVIAPHLGKSVLEVGSGIGTMSKFMLPRCRSLVLSDHKPIYLDKLRDRFGAMAHIDYRLVDLNDLPYDLHGYVPDTIVCLNVLEHIDQHESVLRAFADLLPTGGRLILQVPNYPRLFGSLDKSYGHFRRYSRAGLREVLERAGFRVTLLRQFNPFSIPGWVLTNNVAKARRLNVGSLRLYNSLVPALRAVDIFSRFAGLALIACAEKVERAPAVDGAFARPMTTPELARSGAE